jgi:hypothetical protein
MLPFMSGWKALAARLSLCVCGVLSILVGRTYGSLRLFYGSDRQAWVIFHVVLLVAGIISLGTGVLPESWTRKVMGRGASEASPLRLPLGLLMIFAATSYVIVVLLALLSPSARLSPLATYSLCPACVLTITVDPSPASVLLILAPVTAAIYGAIGAVIGLCSRIVAR